MTLRLHDYASSGNCYVHVAHEAGLELSAAVKEWIGRVEGTQGFMNDLQSYPPNAWPGAGHSIYG